jgi:microcystin-dependent protein
MEMSDQFLGQISIFGFNFPPSGFAQCNGQILSIQQNQALFALLGTTYGGNGTSNFQLPNLQGQVPVHFGQGAGLSPYVLGQSGGQETHTLTVNEMPPHQHTPNYAANADQASPVGNLWAPDPNGNITFANAPNELLASDPANPANNAIGLAGGGQPHENRAPFLVLNFCIALLGIFPTRN